MASAIPPNAAQTPMMASLRTSELDDEALDVVEVELPGVGGDDSN